MVQPRRDRTASAFRIRLVLVCLSAVLSVVLIANGEALIGGLIGAMVVMRIIVLFKRQKWRGEMRRRYARRFGASPRD